MADTVLVPVDGSDPSLRAFEYALEHHGEGDVVVCHAIELAELARQASETTLPPATWQSVLDTARERAENVCEEAQAVADDYGVDVEAETAVGDPADVVVDAIDDHDADHVVMGSHGRTGVSRVLLGSVAERVLRRLTVPVTVVHGD
ncbi:universal stress protein [Haloplanus sp. GCM10025708]|uniref:universal stress protein n=1 Tax=Haloferacaceae TaxID=1644056 RepID=UPI0036171612